MRKQGPDIFDRLMKLSFFKKYNGVYQKKKSVLLYVFFGGLTTVVSIASFAVANQVFLINEHISNIISWILAVSFAYFTNRKWVFLSHIKGSKMIREMVSFFSGRLFTLGVEEAMIFFLVTEMKFDGIIVKTVAQFVILILNYIISRKLVFKRR